MPRFPFTMIRTLPFRPLNVLALALLLASPAFADTIDTRDGSRLVGKITATDAGAITIETAAAGKISVKQSEVTAITTDQPIAVRLANGTRMDGRLSSTAGGVQIAATEGTISTTVGEISATWGAGKPDPLYARHWAYEAGVDVAGKTGNSEQLGTAADFRAVLKSAQDTLQFYAGYNRQITDGKKAADQFKAGVDYQNNFAGRNAWYMRDEGGFDRVKDIDLYNIAAAGYGFDVIKEPRRTLTGRLGLAFRYEGYGNPATEDVKSLGLDVGLNSDIEFANSKLVSRINYVPAFENFNNYRIIHESYYQLPLAHPAWKLRIGVANDYNSQPPPGIARLDTAYFTRLVLTWR